MAKKDRDELVFLGDIIECIEMIERYVGNLSEKEFEDNSEKQDAVIRRIEIIGEAVKNISKKTRERYPDIPRLREALPRAYYPSGFARTTLLIRYHTGRARMIDRTRQSLARAI